MSPTFILNQTLKNDPGNDFLRLNNFRENILCGERFLLYQKNPKSP